MAVTRIGIVGIGNMGLPMAVRLQSHGYAVTVCDNDPARASQATRHRLRVAPSPADAAVHSRCTIIAVATQAQVAAVLFGDGGVAEVAKMGDCVMLCSNQPAQAVEQQAAVLAERGVHCIDAPLSGGPDRAAYGTIAMLLACEPTLFERHRPMIEVLSSRVIRVGERVGMASHATMVNNLAAAINLAGMAEAMALAQRVGLDPWQVLEIIEGSSGQSWIGSDRFVRAQRGDRAVQSRVDLLGHETLFAAQAAEALGIDAPLAAAAARLFERACAAGLAAADDCTLFPFVRDGTVVEDVTASADDAQPEAPPVLGRLSAS
jgi:L-threonate 2-dehydrogenase